MRMPGRAKGLKRKGKAVALIAQKLQRLLV